MFSKDDESASPDAGAANPDGQPTQQPFMNPQQTTGDGNFQAMFEQAPGTVQPGMPMAGGAGADPRATAPGQQPSAAPGIQQHYLASELLAFIPPALAAQGGIPMEQTIAIELPANGSTDVRLSTICAACPQLFAVEITPLNDSVVTLPPRLAAAPQQQAAPQAGGMDLASMRANSGGSAFASNPFADAVQSPIHPDNKAPAAQAPPAASPFGAPPAAESKETPSQFGFPAAPASAGAQSGVSPFGAPPQAAPNPAAAEPSGATPTVGFSAIGPIPGADGSGEGGGSVFGAAQPAKPESIFPGGNPFDEPAAGAPAAQPAQPEVTPPAAAPANPFGGESPFGAPGAPAAPEAATPNPFDSSASFSTVFSEKAQEDSQVEAPSPFGAPAGAAATPVHATPEVNAAPEVELPTVEDALPPQVADAPNPFAQFEASPAPVGENPFGQLDAAIAPAAPAPAPAPVEEVEDFADMLPPQANEALASPFGQPAAEVPSVESQPEPAEVVPQAAPTPQPSAGFEPPSSAAPAAAVQHSPFDPIAAPAEASEAPAAAPTQASPFGGGDESDNFDDLSPFTAAIGARNSFFDEVAGAEPAPQEAAPAAPEEQKAVEPPVAEAAPERKPAPVAEMSPAPRDAVVKNVELRAVFGTDEDFTPDAVAVKTVAIEGIATCAIQVADGTSQAARPGESTMALSQIKSLSESARHIAALTGVADAGAFTMHTDKGLISIFSHEDATVFVRHLAGEFDPGVREKLMLITRGVASL